MLTLVPTPWVHADTCSMGACWHLFQPPSKHLFQPPRIQTGGDSQPAGIHQWVLFHSPPVHLAQPMDGACQGSDMGLSISSMPLAMPWATPKHQSVDRQLHIACCTTSCKCLTPGRPDAREHSPYQTRPGQRPCAHKITHGTSLPCVHGPQQLSTCRAATNTVPCPELCMPATGHVVMKP